MLDRSSLTWLTLRTKIKAEIERLRDELETSGLSPEPIRGQITALRWVIKTVEPDAPITEPTSTDYLSVGDSTALDADPS